MKVVINAYSARQGGGQTYLKNLLAHLPFETPIEVLVFAPSSLALPENPRIRRVRSRWPTTNPVLRTLWEKWRLPAFLRRERADVLFCPGGVVATRVPRGCKVVTMFRNMIPFDPRAMTALPWGLQRLRSILLRRVMLRSMQKADLTIFISDFARETIERLGPIPNPLTIPHGIANIFRTDGQAAPRPASLGDRPYLLYVSKFDTYKHQVEVVRGYAMLSEELRARTNLALVGEVDRSSTLRINALIEELGLGDHVIVHGPAGYDELPAMYLNATANIFASSCENCPNILLEALAAGRPVLSSDVPPMPEFGGDGILYFSPFDPRSISEAMEKVLTNDEAARQCAAAALAQSHSYDWSISAGRTWRAIESLYAQSASR
jgi:glycosyltransferase involved in cell wall biosynthesis